MTFCSILSSCGELMKRCVSQYCTCKACIRGKKLREKPSVCTKRNNNVHNVSFTAISHLLERTCESCGSHLQQEQIKLIIFNISKAWSLGHAYIWHGILCSVIYRGTRCWFTLFLPALLSLPAPFLFVPSSSSSYTSFPAPPLLPGAFHEGWLNMEKSIPSLRWLSRGRSETLWWGLWWWCGAGVGGRVCCSINASPLIFSSRLSVCERPLRLLRAWLTGSELLVRLRG